MHTSQELLSTFAHLVVENKVFPLCCISHCSKKSQM